jgi:hypothetical protein
MLRTGVFSLARKMPKQIVIRSVAIFPESVDLTRSHPKSPDLT